MPFEVEILLSVYNGEKFLEEQLNSILNQVFSDWRLLIRDDGSTDNTVSIIKKYEGEQDGKIIFFEEPSVHLGITSSFDFLLQQSSLGYIAFCDQDDVWKPDKLLDQLKVMRESELNYSRSTPILVHSDLVVVDEHCIQIYPSLWSLQNLRPESMNSVKKLLIQNYVTGCASVLNRALVDKMKNIPAQVILHDWWSALVAASSGRIVSMNEATVFYRQHSNNEIGAQKYSIFAFFKKYRNAKKELEKTVLQANALLQTGLLDTESKKVVVNYINMFQYGWLKRRVLLLRGGYLKYGLARNFGMMLYM